MPYALERAALDFEVQGCSPLNPQLMSVLLVACTMETVDWYQAVLSHAGLKAKVIEVQSHAQVRGVDAMVPSSGAVALVDFALHTTRLTILHQGRVMDSRELLFGNGLQDQATFKTTAVQHIRRGLEQSAASPRAESVILAGAAAAQAEKIIPDAAAGGAVGIGRAQVVGLQLHHHVADGAVQGAQFAQEPGLRRRGRRPWHSRPPAAWARLRGPAHR